MQTKPSRSLVPWTALTSLLVALLLSPGCKGPSGPEFDPTLPSASAAPVGGDRAIELPANLFVSIHPTNQLQPSWLARPRADYQLGPGDVFELELLDQPGSASSLTVGPDGKIYYSLLPGVFVWGMTLQQAREEIATQLSQFLKSKPVVVIRLTEANSRQIWLLGSVQAPGVYKLSNPTTLLEALTAAGGPLLSAAGGIQQGTDLKNSFLLRKGNLLGVDFHKLVLQGDLSQNLYLEPDDFIYLKPASLQVVYVLGAVAGARVVPHRESTSLVSAITAAQGTLNYAHLAQVVIIRGSLSSPTIAEVSYKSILAGRARDVLLEPGDIVYIPYSPYRKLLEFGDAVLQNFVRTVALNEGRNAVIQNTGPIPFNPSF